MANPQEPFKRISVEEAKKILDSGKAELIDVRQPHEWAAGHINGAKLIPVDSLFERIGEVSEDKDIVFQCAVGVRSALACEIAAAMGRTRIFNMEGGIDAWKAKKFPTVAGK